MEKTIWGEESMALTDLCTYKNCDYNYEMTECLAYIEDYGNVMVYGIKIYNDDRSEFNSIEDISDDFEFVDGLCRLMCSENVSPVQLIDIAEDFISELYSL